MATDRLQGTIDALVSDARKLHTEDFGEELKLHIDPNGTFAISFADRRNLPKYWFQPKLIVATRPLTLDLIESLGFVSLKGRGPEQRYEVLEICEGYDEETRAEAIFWYLSTDYPPVTTVRDFDRVASSFSYHNFILWREIRSSMEYLLPLMVVKVRGPDGLVTLREEFRQRSFSGPHSIVFIGFENAIVIQSEVNGMFAEYRIILEDAWMDK